MTKGKFDPQTGMIDNGYRTWKGFKIELSINDESYFFPYEAWVKDIGTTKGMSVNECVKSM